MTRLLLILGSALVLFPPQHAGGTLYALYDVYHTHKRLFSALIPDYRPIYRIDVAAQAGDIFRIAGSLEVSENDQKHNRIYAYLSVRPAAVETRARVSSFAWQVAIRGSDQNHHMTLNLFGRYEVPSRGDYIVELMARRTEDSQVLVEDIEYEESDRGQIIVELYRPYASVQSALHAGAHLLVDTDRAPFNPVDVRVPPKCPFPPSPCKPPEKGTYYGLPGTKYFGLAAGDILRVQGAATSQFIGGVYPSSLFALHLRVRVGGDGDERLSVAPENLTGVLFRFTLQNDGVYRATTARTASAYQNVSYHFGSHVISEGSTADVVAMHFTNAPNTRTAAFLSGTQTLTATSDLAFTASEPTRELFSVSGPHRAGDVLRAQSQVQLEMIAGETGAACWARIEIYENGVLTYRSIFDERFIRNSSDNGRDHDAGAFSPFALYRTRQAGDHRVRLITDCNAASAATMRAKGYGRHLTIDHFTTAEP